MRKVASPPRTSSGYVRVHQWSGSDRVQGSASRTDKTYRPRGTKAQNDPASSSSRLAMTAFVDRERMLRAGGAIFRLPFCASRRMHTRAFGQAVAALAALSPSPTAIVVATVRYRIEG